MKKLFVAGLSALMIFGVASCGTKSYDDKVLKAGNNAAGDQIRVYLDGQFAGWGANGDYEMQATSIKEVSGFSTALADKLAGKSLEFLYVIDHTFTDDAGYEKGYYGDNGDWVVVNGNCTFKFNEGYYNEDKEIHVAETWLPNSMEDATGGKHLEALTDNVFIPPFQKEEDSHGLSWISDLVLKSGVGKYKVVLAKYTVLSSTEVAGYGVGCVKVD